MLEFDMGQMVTLKKPHPCGSFQWQIYRLGADIGIICQGCGHRVLVPRSRLERRLKGNRRVAGSGS